MCDQINKQHSQSALLLNPVGWTNTAMPFTFSFSSSATFVASTSVNGNSNGWAYRHESYSNNNGSGVRTTQQRLGEAPVMQTMMYDAHGRPLLTQGSANGYAGGYANGRGNGYTNANGYGNGHVQMNGNQRHAPTNQRVPSRRIISIEDVTEEEDQKAAANHQNGERRH